MTGSVRESRDGEMVWVVMVMFYELQDGYYSVYVGVGWVSSWDSYKS